MQLRRQSLDHLVVFCKGTLRQLEGNQFMGDSPSVHYAAEFLHIFPVLQMEP